ncbi:MFS general substrate transporter [Hygrophoropsis aurantiaca]|uniref:MFS general substrate transporter n=1 Tax=Hygrophoropsis aurantiaca TaxID=72124 RepID=A0ACB8ACY4_9AGAM|nr:MFS general substrate transporter [Hygrophoropsis aurantiaca]
MSSFPDPEYTPLLANNNIAHDGVYHRFTRSQKRLILAIVSWAGVIPFFLSGSFMPSIPQIAKDLDSTPATISLSISFATFASGLGTLFWGTYSSYYGRRPIYLASVPCLVVSSLGSGLSTTAPELFIWRSVQAFGAGSGLSVGGAVVGDIYKLEERGKALGIFIAVQLIGPAVGPLLGGAATHYASWRVLQYLLCIGSMLTFVLAITFLPETSHPGSRGMDKASLGSGNPPRFVIINPLNSLRLLRSPLLLLQGTIGSFVLFTDFVLWVPLSYTIGERYGISNETLIGACFLPSGIGSLIGAPLAGWLSDKIVKTLRAKRDGKWVPEDRIRGTEFGSLFLVPVSVALAGFSSRYVDGMLGVILNLIALFLNGLGVVLALAPLGTYVIDVFHKDSAEASAATNAMRLFLCAFMTTGIMPSLDHYGVLITNLLSASLAWVAYGLLVLMIRYGDKLRAMVDVGFSTIQPE